MCKPSCFSLFVLAKVSNFDVAFLSVRYCKNSYICIRIKGTETLWIIARVKTINQRQICKVVNVDLHLKDNHDSIVCLATTDEILTYLSEA